MHRGIMLVLLLGALLLAGCPSGSEPVDIPDGGIDINQAKADMLARHNTTRTAAGVGALSSNAQLDQIALQQAQYNASIGNTSHTDAQGGRVNDRADAIGYNWQHIGENLGFSTTPDRVYDLWLGSSGHRGNIEDGSFTEIGIGIVEEGAIYYCCVVFGTPL